MKSMKFDWKKFDYFLLFAAAATLLALLHPGDTVWLRDEARLMALALDANEAGHPALHGLPGSTGVAYGALIVWLNQLLLLVTSDPVTMVAFKGILLLGLCWGALLRLARCLHLPAGPGAALWFCSPFIWFYLRMPWDNIWLLPMSLWYAVCAAHFFRDGKMMPVVWAGVVFALMFYLHPVSVAIPLGFAAGVLLFRRELFRREWRKFCAVGAGVLLVLSPYLYMCARGYSPGVGAPRVSFFTALGGVVKCWQNLTAFGFTDRFAPEVGLGIPGMWVVLSVPVIVFFMILGIIAVIRRWRRKELNTFDRLCVCGGIMVFFLAAELLILRVEPQTHYNSVVSFTWLLLAWRGFTALRSDYRKTAQFLLCAALILELLLLADFSRMVHRYSGGSSEYFGTTLARQWRVVRSLTAARQANPALVVELEIDRLREDPLPLQVLIRLALRSGDLPEIVGTPLRARLLPARSGSGIDLLLLE